ncbi:conserved Plasmodium protein, unknown function [Plasmodium ovale]|uniref:Uncharacterized protein n=2 Tax=Plasmodium ovale TaxID=36330 RepID=A0A1A8WM88_PLAOA|nr:conserved Plasmodium protein, unknown function [Plasmodium ovale curtisi]SBS92968.1 conserved Plasmodium protein, unknown function [Plasmodium ovale curtisi]SCQ16550.1 conserved Plasmodium protein, unknown function [Plasmodium ovale]
MNIINVRYCFLIFSFFLVEKEFSTNGVIAPSCFNEHHVCEKNKDSSNGHLSKGERNYDGAYKKSRLLNNHVNLLHEETHEDATFMSKYKSGNDLGRSLFYENSGDNYVQKRKQKNGNENLNSEDEKKINELINRDMEENENKLEEDRNDKVDNEGKRENEGEEQEDGEAEEGEDEEVNEKKINELINFEKEKNDEKVKEEIKEREAEEAKQKREERQERQEREKQEVRKEQPQQGERNAGKDQRKGNKTSGIECSNKLSYLEVTSGKERHNQIVRRNDYDNFSKFVDVKMGEKDNNSGKTNGNISVVKGDEVGTTHMNRVKRENRINGKDLHFMEEKIESKGNAKVTEKGNRNTYKSIVDSGIGTDIGEEKLGECNREDEKNGTQCINSKVSFPSLDVYDKMFVTLNKNINIKNIHKHVPQSIFSPRLNGNLKNSGITISRDFASFLSLNTNVDVEMMPINFKVSNSVVKITDDAYNKLMKENSVNVYDKDKLVQYEYENFEVKDDPPYDPKEYNEKGKNDEENENEEDDEDDENAENKKGANGTFNGILVTYAIIILLVVILLLLTFVVYYYDIINKIKMRLTKKRKNNKSMTIANDKSSGIYVDGSYGDSTHV